MDWAPKLKEFAWACVDRDGDWMYDQEAALYEFVEQLIRDVQRETAEECALTIWDFDPSLADMIRERFLAPKENTTRKQLIAELARQEQADGHYRCDLPEKQDPFTGPHWKLAEADVRAGVYSAICLCDLRDELRRLREEK